MGSEEKVCNKIISAEMCFKTLNRMKFVIQKIENLRNTTKLKRKFVEKKVDLGLIFFSFFELAFFELALNALKV